MEADLDVSRLIHGHVNGRMDNLVLIFTEKFCWFACRMPRISLSLPEYVIARVTPRKGKLLVGNRGRKAQLIYFHYCNSGVPVPNFFQIRSSLSVGPEGSLRHRVCQYLFVKLLIVFIDKSRWFIKFLSDSYNLSRQPVSFRASLFPKPLTESAPEGGFEKSGILVEKGNHEANRGPCVGDGLYGGAIELCIIAGSECSFSWRQ